MQTTTLNIFYKQQRRNTIVDLSKKIVYLLSLLKGYKSLNKMITGHALDEYKY